MPNDRYLSISFSFDVELKMTQIYCYFMQYNNSNEHGAALQEKLYLSADQSRAANEWHHSEVLRSLQPNSEYEIQVQARNAYGWGSYARDYFLYQTGGTRLIAPPMTIITDHTVRSFQMTLHLPPLTTMMRPPPPAVSPIARLSTPLSYSLRPPAISSPGATCHVRLVYRFVGQAAVVRRATCVRF